LDLKKRKNQLLGLIATGKKQKIRAAIVSKRTAQNNFFKIKKRKKRKGVFL